MSTGEILFLILTLAAAGFFAATLFERLIPSASPYEGN